MRIQTETLPCDLVTDANQPPEDYRMVPPVSRIRKQHFTRLNQDTFVHSWAQLTNNLASANR